MEKTLGIDLGTNSIGLALRNGNDFDWFGVYTFKKGVGEGKAGEFSFAAERTQHRSSRRLYNSRRYRKWATLEQLIKFDLCPLSIEDLSGWKNYTKGMGRTYPLYNKDFDHWIKLDLSGNGKSDFTSPYQLRRELVSKKLDLSIKSDRYKIGRALYHIAQRRGFKSSRKSGKNEQAAIYEGSLNTKTIGRNEYQQLIIEKGTLGSAFAHLEDQGIRIRNRYTLRSDYYSEAHQIMSYQGLNSKQIESLLHAIFYQRPLRSQKGLVGKCTLESAKARCPISHPTFEEFRARCFINNIKYKQNEADTWSELPNELKRIIYNDVYFRLKSSFPFADIRKAIAKNGGKDWILNYKQKADKVSISGCPVSSRLKSVFGKNWLSYTKEVEKINKKGKNIVKTYDIYDIWHILFSFEDEEYFNEFCRTTIKIDDEQIDGLSKIWNAFPVGYANLSLKAIKNILPFLRKGLKYTDAVLIAKIPELIGQSKFDENADLITTSIQKIILDNRNQKELVGIANNLISKYYLLPNPFAFNDTTYILDDDDISDIEKTCKEYFGARQWLQKENQEHVHTEVAKLYQEFFACLDRKHIKPPHLTDQIKDWLRGHFSHLDEKQINQLYHPSQVEIYPSYPDQQQLTSPKTGAFKNPMAYKTLYQLRKVINHLIEIGKIDDDTRIVVEVARELNDSNKRWAIESYQKSREIENREFAIAITELIKDQDFTGTADPNSKTDTDKVRLWTDQLENRDDILKEITATKEDIKKYRLWKEQDCKCIYTGRMISITDLFEDNKVDFEHTIPRSQCFDNSMANLTVCYADYNRNVKRNKIPTALPNYHSNTTEGLAIEPRLKTWKDKTDKLEIRLKAAVSRSKAAMDKSTKDDVIRNRHLLQFEYDYWKNKLDRFMREDVPTGFKNSQLIDTQIISKYAFHYLKTIFKRVDIQKGSTTAVFRKIYQIQPKSEKKNRGKHHHHAIDAAVLTLIPRSSKRDKILKTYYSQMEANPKANYHVTPFEGFKNQSLIEIENTILINNVANRDQALSPGKKLVRRRGKIVWIKDKTGSDLKDTKGNKVPKIAQGDSIRGQLHQDSFYGMIKVANKENGKLTRDVKGDIVINQIDGKDEIWVVKRVLISDSAFKPENIVDDTLRTHVIEQLKYKTVTELTDFNDKSIRHIRCRVKSGRGYMNPENLTKVKEQLNKSKFHYKNFIYADSGDNYLFAMYESEDGKREIKSTNLLDAARIITSQQVDQNTDFFEKEINIGNQIGKLYHIFQTGQKVLFFLQNKEELKELDPSELSKRLYFIKRLHQASVGNIAFQHHIESRTDEQLQLDFPKKIFKSAGKDGFSKFPTSFIAPRLLFKPVKNIFIIEGKDFKMTLDGKIEFLY